MDTEMLASRSGETVELKSIVVLVAHQCDPCRRMVLPSEPFHFREELKGQIGKIRQMAVPCFSNLVAKTTDRWQDTIVPRQRKKQRATKTNLRSVTDKESTSARQGQRQILVPPIRRYATLASQCPQIGQSFIYKKKSN